MVDNSNWGKFKKNFNNIINENNYYLNTLNNILLIDTNILIHFVKGFPTDLYIDEIIKKRFKIKDTIYRNKHIWNKNIPYYENQYFFEIDIANPDMPKDYSFLSNFILHIIKTKNILNQRYFIIIKNIDILKEYFLEFRIILEKYSINALFLCTTFNISKIDAPIISRFIQYRIPLFTLDQISNIFEKYNLTYNKSTFNKTLSRDIIRLIFLADVSVHEPLLITESFSNYNYPPLYDFLKNYNNKTINLEEIRLLSYKCCQFNISIKELLMDVLVYIKTNTIKNKKKFRYNAIKVASELDHLLSITNKGREPIYIESFFCRILL